MFSRPGNQFCIMHRESHYEWKVVVLQTSKGNIDTQRTPGVAAT